MSEETKVEDQLNKINFDLPLLDLNDEPIPMQSGNEDPTRLGEVCCTALMASMQDDKADGTQKLKRFNLARKIQGGVDTDAFPVERLNSKQKKMILDQAEKVFSTLIYARIYEALEGTTEDND